jgi:hypothetical protein
MKNYSIKNSLFVFLLALSAITYSCNKDDDQKSTQQKLIGKWNLVSAKLHDHYSGVNYYDSSAYAEGLIIREFKNDGTLITSSSYSPNKDTSTYKMLDNQKMVIDGTDTVSVIKLTDTDLQIYFKTGPDSNGDYSQEWDNYKKN